MSSTSSRSVLIVFPRISLFFLSFLTTCSNLITSLVTPRPQSLFHNFGVFSCCESFESLRLQTITIQGSCCMVAASPNNLSGLRMFSSQRTIFTLAISSPFSHIMLQAGDSEQLLFPPSCLCLKLLVASNTRLLLRDSKDGF